MDDELTPPPPSIAELKSRFDDEVRFGNDRAAAEYAYVLAVRLRHELNFNEAEKYAREALKFAERLPDATLDDVASTRLSLGGVQLPELFHDDVVRSRLHDLLDV